MGSCVPDNMFGFYFEGNRGSLKGLKQESGRISVWGDLLTFRGWWTCVVVMIREKGVRLEPQGPVRGYPLDVLLSGEKMKISGLCH